MNCFYKDSKIVIFEAKQRCEIIHDIHEEIGESSRLKAMASHCGNEFTQEQLSERSLWFGMVKHVKAYIKQCKNCQRQTNTFKKISPELQST